MTYQQTADYILGIPKFTRKNDVAQTKIFLEYLGRPQDRLKVIHVAGTNGKGSVCAYLDGMLRSEGKRTGLFTSPHLVRLNERIVLDGEQISDDGFCAAFEKTMEAVRRMEGEGLPHPSFFEFLFGMAMYAFAQAEMEYAVLETGLGGRLDATSAVERPLICVIASIGYDHMQYLGDTLEEIAGEKAGIIRPGVPVFFSSASDESDSVILRTAREKKSFCKKIGKDAFEILGIQNKHIAFSCSSAYYGTTTWKLNNTGIYQPQNALLAMEVMRYLFGEEGHPDRWREALAELKWEGRMEELLPDIYIDGAHNISAIEAFVESVPQGGAGNVVLFSAVQDKDYEKMAAYLGRNMDAELYIVTHIDDARGEDAEILGEIFRKYTKAPVEVKHTVWEAFTFVREHQEGRRIYCLGSLYLAGKIKELIQEGI